MLHYHDDLRAVREFTARWAARAGLLPDRGRDLMTAVSELAANTLAHTNGPGTLTISVTSSEIICQIQDNGQITGPRRGGHGPIPPHPQVNADCGSCAN